MELEHEISSDGRIVWVNSAQGMCIGRFSAKGCDVHKDMEAQMRGGSQCLDCRHDLPFDEMWGWFKAAMLKHYNIVVEDQHKPNCEGQACL